MKGKILVVDDEKLITWSLGKDLSKEGYGVLTADNAEQGIKLFGEELPDVVLLDIRLPDGSGTEVLKILKKKNPMANVIMITANDEIHTAVQCMRDGAYTYLQKPVNFEELCLNIERALEEARLRRKVTVREQFEKGKYDFESVIAGSEVMNKVLAFLKQIVHSDASTVLMEGESGTGKDLIARALHFSGPRVKKEFISINCAAMPDTLLESELFGHEKGAFTDAHQTKRGLVEEASGGTLFFDEIGDMQKGLQAKLLHLIDQKKFRKVGGVKELEADIRVIAATNKDLKSEVKKGHFREDLYYRLNVIRIHLPPLRERRDDIQPLTRFFIEHYNAKFGATIQSIEPMAMEMLLRYDWPGNVRELKNVIERAMILNRGNVLQCENLPAEIECRCMLKDMCRPLEAAKSTELPRCLSGVPLETVERHMILLALRDAAGNQSKAAERLGIGRDAIRYKIQKYGLDKDQEASKVGEIAQSLPPS